MSYVEKLCTKCCHLFGVDENDKDDICDCGGKLVTMELEHSDYITLCHIWSTGTEIDRKVHWDLYNAMVELKKKDIIEYNLKMSQFRNQLNQQQSTENKLRCPTCSSTRVKQISTTAKVAGAVTFGLFSKTARSQFKCENCGYKW